MPLHPTQYEMSQEHLGQLSSNLMRLGTALHAYINSDHHSQDPDSPFMLEMSEALIGLNVQVERLIQRIDPAYEGTYTGNQ